MVSQIYTETNLKKQGVLPLIFDNSSDYDKIQPSDRVSLLNLNGLAPGKVSDKIILLNFIVIIQFI